MCSDDGGPGLEPGSIATRLAGQPADVRPVRAGRNSAVYSVDTADGRFALKLYPRSSSDPDRLLAEVDALRLLEAAAISNVPRVVATDADLGAALFTWIEGRAPSQITAPDLDHAITFLTAIHALRFRSCAKRIRLAREACLSGTELARQVDERVERLLTLSKERELSRFLTASLLPRLIVIKERALAFERAFMAPEALLPFNLRTLSPSDFGFHNSLRDDAGRLSFVDFEYFGWDDPVKLVSDILLHPGHALDVRQRDWLRATLCSLYGSDDRHFARRLEAYLPLFGVRWVLIVLNEFLPERWTQRVRAGLGGDWDAVKSAQIRRARSLMAAVEEVHRSGSLSEIG